MKIAIWILVAIAAVSPVILFLFQKWRANIAEKTGTAVYATVIAMEPVKAFGRPSDIMKITLWIQEPGEARREITLRTRVAVDQPIKPGMMLPVVIDPKNPKRVYPAGPDAAKRAVATGSRGERRMMQAQMRNPGRNPSVPGGYMPPMNVMQGKGKRR